MDPIRSRAVHSAVDHLVATCSLYSQTSLGNLETPTVDNEGETVLKNHLLCVFQELKTSSEKGVLGAEAMKQAVVTALKAHETPQNVKDEDVEQSALVTVQKKGLGATALRNQIIDNAHCIDHLHPPLNDEKLRLLIQSSGSRTSAKVIRSYQAVFASRGIPQTTIIEGPEADSDMEALEGLYELTKKAVQEAEVKRANERADLSGPQATKRPSQE